MGSNLLAGPYGLELAGIKLDGAPAPASSTFDDIFGALWLAVPKKRVSYLHISRDFYPQSYELHAQIFALHMGVHENLNRQASPCRAGAPRKEADKDR